MDGPMDGRRGRCLWGGLANDVGGNNESMEGPQDEDDEDG